MDWNPPPDDVEHVTSYMLYFSRDAGGVNRSYYHNVMVGIDNFTIPVDTKIYDFTHMLIYTQSSLTEQTTPAVLSLFDAVASVSSLFFIDKDLDQYELGGTITWDSPLTTSPTREDSYYRVKFYDVYLAYQHHPWARSRIGDAVPRGTDTTFILP